MAARATGTLKGMVQRLRPYTTSTAPKSKAYAPATEFNERTAAAKGDYVPVYVSIGMISLSISFGLYTAYLHLRDNPGVRVSKKTRETLPELEDPDKIVDEARRLVEKSWFRKIAHVQEFDKQEKEVMPDPIRKDQFAHKPRAVTLKDVGIDPKRPATAAH